MGILEALQYGLSSLNKPGRAVRGLLGGNAREGLAALPFSDMMGVTDPGDEVTSDHLLRQLGGDPDTDMGTVGSLGLGVATDPLTYAGGFLAKRLMGGAAAEAGGAAKASDIYDLVSPEERARSARNAAFDIEGAFEKAPVREMEGTPRIIHKAELDPYTEAGQDATMPGGELLRELPPIHHYGFQLGIDQHGVYDPALHGISSDLLRDGDLAGAWDLHHQQWDQALNDLERLHPKAKMDLQGGFLEPIEQQPLGQNVFERGELGPGHELGDDVIQLGHPDSVATDPLGLGDGGTPWRPHYPGSEVGQDWQRILSQRHGDLTAIRDLDGALINRDANLYKGSLQRERIDALRADHHPPSESAARYAAGDFLGGHVQPSSVHEFLSPIDRETTEGVLAHLPLDPVALRKIAAEAQRDELLAAITGHLQHNDTLAVGMTGPLPTGGEGQVFGAHLHEALDPTAARYASTEPGIVKQLLADPGTDEYGQMIWDAKRRLEEYLAANPAFRQEIAIRRRLSANPLRHQNTADF